MHDDVTPQTGADGLRLAVVVSRYHESITRAMRDGAVEAFAAAGGRRDDLLVVPVPGSFELTALCRELAHSGEFDAIVALGCVITGETTHDQYICQAVANGLTSITVQTGVPIGFGLLTCQSVEQARARAGGTHGNKGAEAMRAAIATALAIRRVQDRSPAPRGRR
jgi:6,7-dimethyl-8-ribityllumazine synthase